MKISFVLPVYNVGRWLGRCLDSILAQGLPEGDYEIVVVNDSSTDDSRAVAATYAAAHPPVRLIDQVPNAGVAAARNRAIDEARGEYVWPVDPDDYLFPGVAGEMIALMDRDRLDLLTFLCRTVDEGGDPIEWKYSPKIEIKCPGVLTGQRYMLCNDYVMPVHQYVYRRAFLNDNGLRMLSGWVHEDTDFTPMAMSLAGRVEHYPHEVYNYTKRTGSIMNNFKAHHILSAVEVTDRLNRFIHSGVVTDKKVLRHLRGVISLNLYNSIRLNMRYGFTDAEELIAEARRRGLIPMANPRGHLNRFLLNHSTAAYLWFNRKVRKPK